MVIRLQIKVFSSDNQEGLTYQKDYESLDVPVKGSMVLDPIFAEPKEVTRVLHNYQKRRVLVFLKDKEVKPLALQGHIQEVAELHKWTLAIPEE